jgi:hypothetical protein
MGDHEQVGMCLMVGGGGRESDVERTLRRARQAAAQDLLDQASHIPGLNPIVVLSDDNDWLEGLDGSSIHCQLTHSDQAFHFGAALTDVIKQYRFGSCFYIGGGSGPLLSATTLAQVIQTVQADEPVLVTNNLHSSDWAAFSPAEAILPLVEWLEHDNALAWVWQEKTGHPVRALVRTAATQMDIDTPFDLLALQRHPGTHRHLRVLLKQLDWPSGHLDATVEVLRRDASQVIVAGRVSSWIWRILEQRTRAWIRIFAEERGMRASGRQERGEVRSLLNDYLDLVGVERFFQHLAEMADAVLLDSRVILASRNLWPCDSDRFYSDLLMVERVNEPFLRAFTAAARSSPVPVVLGGHSLVAGGLAVLLEGAGFVTFA